MAKTSTLMDATKRMQKIAGETKDKPSNDNIKITLYIRHDQMFALEEIRTKRLKAGARLGDVDKSKLMREAIDLLIRRENR